jgi:hypothetical protein
VAGQGTSYPKLSTQKADNVLNVLVPGSTVSAARWLWLQLLPFSLKCSIRRASLHLHFSNTGAYGWTEYKKQLKHKNIYITFALGAEQNTALISNVVAIK